jgi:hypothetical protein
MDKKKLAEKANSYAKYVREMYAPSVSDDPQRIVHKENMRPNNFAEDRSDNSGISLPHPRARRNGTADERSTGAHGKVSKLPPAPIVANSVNISSNPERARQYQPPSYMLKNNLGGGGFSSEPESVSVHQQKDFMVRRSHPKKFKGAEAVQPDTASQKPPYKDYLREMKSKREQN